MKEEKVQRGKEIIKELVNILREISDSEVGQLLGTGAMDDFLRAILDPSKVKNYDNYGEFFLANKARSSLLASMRYVITQNYSLKSTYKGQKFFASPHFVQWFEDGVMCLEGKTRFSGFIALYRNKEVRYAIIARDIRRGEEIGPEHFEFISLEEANQRLKTIPPQQISDLERPIRELKNLLTANETNESEYQEFMQRYPWVLGFQYRSIQNHRKLDDKNIPDFTGVRIHDNYRDIIEIKQPFIPIFHKKDGGFNSEFNKAWNQVERYLNFARQEKDYLRRKGLRFDNPKCFLFVGFKISDEELQKIRTKERLNPAIKVMSYDNLIRFVRHTIDFVKNLKAQS